MLAAILKNDLRDSHLRWEEACNSLGINFRIIDLTDSAFIELLRKEPFDFCLAQPPGHTSLMKSMYDERIFAIENYLKKKVFPSFHEIVLHENKKVLAYFLNSKKIPHPRTLIFYDQLEAFDHINTIEMPVVIKTSIGAAGSGVKILHSRGEVKKFIARGFRKGFKRRYGPNRKTGSPGKWLIKAIKSPGYFLSKISEYSERSQDIQKGFAIIQEYIPHEFEWRMVKIGDSFFAYKKLKIDNQASGSKVFEYGPPPIELLDFTRNLCNKEAFNFMAVDLFYVNKKIYVNELQTIFGHKNPYICMVNDVPGRYLYNNGNWVFEEGSFNENESYTLRLREIMKILGKSDE